MKFTFLGTGTSQGVPVIGCRCEVCTSPDRRDRRLRTAAMIETQGVRMVIDAGPDFRFQMLRTGVRRIDAILLTHEHKDHIGGLDDVRAFNFVDYPTIRRISIFANARTAAAVRKDFDYAFAADKYRGVPEIELHEIDPATPFCVERATEQTVSDGAQKTPTGQAASAAPMATGPQTVYETDDKQAAAATSQTDMTAGDPGTTASVAAPAGATGTTAAISTTAANSCPGVEVIPIAGHHSPRFEVTGYRIGPLAYLTDFKSIDEAEIEKLHGVEVLVINALRHTPHDSHLSVGEALALIRRLQPHEAYLTHMSHEIGLHAASGQALPEGVHLAYDTLQIEIPE